MDSADRDSFADLAPSGLSLRWPLLCFAATFGLYVALIPRVLLYSSPPTEWYGYHLPGLSFVWAPAWIVGSWFSLCGRPRSS
jgi:hypothetical protein